MPAYLRVRHKESPAVIIILLYCRPDKYDLLENNCNTFSNEAAQFLTGKEVPSYIIDLPKEVMTTLVLGGMLLTYSGIHLQTC